METRIEAVQLSWTDGANIIVGQSHFIKTVEDIAEIMATSVPGARYGLAFNEASGPCLVRTAGNDEGLVRDATACALATGAGHTFYLVLGAGAYPINVLDRVKACQEVCRIFCATANPVQAVVARTAQGSGLLGVIDGSSPAGVEGPADKAERIGMLRAFGYKFA
ncbi:MAG TPA: adenosine-specific kinase [Spirochaetales bacterium]|nr:adenosine-specific kinase [Spirochaetales bacterium]HPG85082.1 adenosine-specific kinase [Spirochaetales bacterium]HPM72041.1 adenosine-specific kinase [Spirochaetales bacterium]